MEGFPPLPSDTTPCEECGLPANPKTRTLIVPVEGKGAVHVLCPTCTRYLCELGELKISEMNEDGEGHLEWNRARTLGRREEQRLYVQAAIRIVKAPPCPN